MIKQLYTQNKSLFTISHIMILNYITQPNHCLTRLADLKISDFRLYSEQRLFNNLIDKIFENFYFSYFLGIKSEISHTESEIPKLPKS